MDQGQTFNEGHRVHLNLQCGARHAGLKFLKRDGGHTARVACGGASRRQVATVVAVIDADVGCRLSVQQDGDLQLGSELICHMQGDRAVGGGQRQASHAAVEHGNQRLRHVHFFSGGARGDQGFVHEGPNRIQSSDGGIDRLLHVGLGACLGGCVEVTQGQVHGGGPLGGLDLGVFGLAQPVIDQHFRFRAVGVDQFKALQVFLGGACRLGRERL